MNADETIAIERLREARDAISALPEAGARLFVARAVEAVELAEALIYAAHGLRITEDRPPPTEGLPQMASEEQDGVVHRTGRNP